MKSKTKPSERLDSPVSYGCSPDPGDGDFWDEAACVANTMATGIGGAGLFAAGIGGPAAGASFGVASVVVGLAGQGLGLIDDAFFSD